MDLLVTETDIRTRMSLPENAELSEPLLSALGAASVQIESDLGVQFLEQFDLIDIFHVNVKLFWNTLPHDLAVLRLRTGFVEKESVVLRVFDTMLDAMDSSIVGELISDKYYALDVERGIIKLNANYYDNCFVSVIYNSGFEDADDESIPDWLKEAIISKVPQVLASQKPSAHTPESIALANEQAKQTDQLVARYRRTNIPFAFNPVITINADA